MSAITDEVYACTRCHLSSTCRRPIPWDGTMTAQILVIGEAPWANEDIQGVPFVGRSGKLLTSILEGLDLRRDRDYYITNIVKCRPPENRDPTEEEITICSDYLIRQIQAMRPRVVVTLGRFSFGFLVAGRSISEAHGKLYRIHAIRGIPLEEPVLVLACYHPASALYSPAKRSVIEEDLGRLPHILSMDDPHVSNEQ